MSIYPNGKGVVCKTTDFNQNWFDSNSTQLLLIILCILNLYFEKKTTSIIYITTFNGITINTQILTIIFVLFLNNIKSLILLKFFKKIQLFFFLKKQIKF